MYKNVFDNLPERYLFKTTQKISNKKEQKKEKCLLAIMKRTKHLEMLAYFSSKVSSDLIGVFEDYTGLVLCGIKQYIFFLFKMKLLICLFSFISMLSLTSSSKENTRWQQDLTNDMKIGVTTEGFDQAVLECSADWMAFVITLEKEFQGVVYTRGNFYQQHSPCFKKAKGEKDLALKIPYKECGGKHDSSEGGYVNTVIVQHDQDVIMPGDLAFKLVCKDEKTVTGSIGGIRSQIMLVDPDPAKKEASGGAFSSMSPSNIVTIKPMKAAPIKEEL